MNLSKVVYLPQAKWKAGERKAFKTARFPAERLVPAFVVPPSGSFDPDKQRVLSATEYLRSFGQQLADVRGRRLAFVDASLVDDEEHRAAVGSHPLTELLERAWISGASAAPIVAQANSDDYRAAVRRFLERNSALPLCLRVKLDELEGFSSAAELEGRALSLGAAPERTVLLIDGGPLEIADPVDLAGLLAFQLARLIRTGTWLRVFWSATTFPNRPKIAAGEVARFERADWQLYKELMKHRDELPVVPMYSDYMLEYPAHYAPARVAPTAKLMYSSEVDYLISKGRSTKVADKYRNIFSVARALVSSPEMMPQEFSFGDAFIHQLATGIGRTGAPSTWRWCATDHYLAMLNEQLSHVLGLAREKTQEMPEVEQLRLV